MTARRVAILHYSGPPGIGGVEATIAAHARLLLADGRRVRIVAGGGAAPDPVVEMVVDPLLGSRQPRVEAANAELARGAVTDAFRGLVAEIEEILAAALAGCDVAIVHNVHTLHKNLALTAALAGLHAAGRAPRLLAWAHDFAWRDPLYLPELHAGWPWSLLREPWPGVRYVAVSADRRDQLADLLGIAPGAIAVVPPGVDLDRLLKLEPATSAIVREYNLLAADPLLVLPARITRRKNIELGLRIVAALRGVRPAPLLVVTGPPGPHNPTNVAYLDLLRALRAEVQAPAIFLHETFRDAAGAAAPITDPMIADWFGLADALLFPSRAEGFGMPLIEAAARGVPVFCADIPPFREIAGDHAHYFGLDEPPTAIARRLAGALAADRRLAWRREVRRHSTWDAIYRRSIRPLLAGGSNV